MLELAVPFEVFGGLPPGGVYRWYSFAVCGERIPTVRTNDDLLISVRQGLSALSGADTIIISGWRMPHVGPSRELLDALVREHRRGARIAAICGGIFVAAAAGLLDGRRTAVHENWADRLRRQFPRVEPVPDAVYVDDGEILTAAGSAAAIDMCLHLVRRDHGAAAAEEIAYRMLAPPPRDGTCRTPFPTPRRHGQAERLSAVMKWLDENLAAPTTLSEIAQRVGMTERTLLRHFKASTGQTPMDWLVQRRVARARSLIESSDLSIGEIAIETGFGSAEALRYHFSRLMSAPPSAYRRGGLRPDP